ncbi:hypothetical protein F4678DRAFT_453244 [Xylaria arbuscula]|nr:hypothetical protein F4678DRAFT_453244 [Xylaria arbuscula]
MRTWLRIIHCDIFGVFTIPRPLHLVLHLVFQQAAVPKALGTPRNLTVSQQRMPLEYVFQQPFHDPLNCFNSSRVIVTPAVYPRLVELLHFDIQSTGQKSHCVNITF